MSRSIAIAPSVLSADFAHLDKELESISHADYIHYDVMDGRFVPNISFGPRILKDIKKVSSIPVDCHLMIVHPEELVDSFIDAGADMITFHLEATNHAPRLIHYIQSHGVKAGIVINPQTPVAMLEHVIQDVDMVLVMSVNPGFGGQSYIPQSTLKISQVVELARKHDVHPLIQVDGGISQANAAEVAAAGADVLVAGSAVFKQADRNEAIDRIRQQAESGLETVR